MLISIIIYGANKSQPPKLLIINNNNKDKKSIRYLKILNK